MPLEKNSRFPLALASFSVVPPLNHLVGLVGTPQGCIERDEGGEIEFMADLKLKPTQVLLEFARHERHLPGSNVDVPVFGEVSNGLKTFQSSLDTAGDVGG